MIYFIVSAGTFRSCSSNIDRYGQKIPDRVSTLFGEALDGQKQPAQGHVSISLLSGICNGQLVSALKGG